MGIPSVRLVRRKRSYRGAFDIVAAALQAVLRGEGTIANIKNSADLSSSQLKRCLLLSLEHDLLIMDQRDAWIYRITQKGLHFLDVYEKISEMVLYTKSFHGSQLPKVL